MMPHPEASSFEPKKKPSLTDVLKAAATQVWDANIPKPQVPFEGVGFDKYPGAKVDPVKVGDLSNPSAANYDSVIDQFKVGLNPRYTPKDGKTFCNVFATDVMLAMGATVPTPAYAVDANQYSDWLAKKSPPNGWKAVTAEEAQKMANSGKPVLASWKNEGPGGHGHVAVVRPGTVDPTDGPTLASAGGGACFDKGNVALGFKDVPPNEIKYYVFEGVPKPKK